MKSNKDCSGDVKIAIVLPSRGFISLTESEGSQMLYYTVTEQKADNSYQKSQEQILTTLLTQVGSGYTAARLQIMLRHTRASMPAAAVSTRPVGMF